MTDPYRPDPTKRTDVSERAWRLAASRMSRPAYVLFRMKARGWSNERIQRRLRISRRRLVRYLIEAIGHIDRAFCEIEGPG
jgi:hypothetical protein